MPYRLISGIFNGLFALIFLIIACPLFLIIAIVIKLDSKGPIFFCQKRFGYKGRIFTCFKFRTMKVDAPPNFSKKEMAKRANKDITKVGRILRIWGLDELPQLINILFGQMVLIGWRPSPLSIIEVCELRQKNQIYQIKPGLTGWAQVQQDLAGYIFTPIEQVAHDKFYLINQSLWLDIKIIFLTFKVILSGRHS
jgi:O-antigen biosynthesis protein WbqP